MISNINIWRVTKMGFDTPEARKERNAKLESRRNSISETEKKELALEAEHNKKHAAKVEASRAQGKSCCAIL
jgi:hypothetical protein